MPINAENEVVDEVITSRTKHYSLESGIWKLTSRQHAMNCLKTQLECKLMRLVVSATEEMYVDSLKDIAGYLYCFDEWVRHDNQYTEKITLSKYGRKTMDYKYTLYGSGYKRVYTKHDFGRDIKGIVNHILLSPDSLSVIEESVADIRHIIYKYGSQDLKENLGGELYEPQI